MVGVPLLKLKFWDGRFVEKEREPAAASKLSALLGDAWEGENGKAKVEDDEGILPLE